MPSEYGIEKGSCPSKIDNANIEIKKIRNDAEKETEDVVDKVKYILSSSILDPL